MIGETVEEVFRYAVTAAGGLPGGLQLETTPDDVTECVMDAADMDHVGVVYTTFCDPRLNPAQAFAAVGAWGGAAGSARDAGLNVLSSLL